MENNELQNEQIRVNNVIKKITTKIDQVDAEFTRAYEETKRVQQNYSTNTSVNYFEVDDRIETSAELQQQRGLISRLTENQNILKKQLFTYKELQVSPYFGRIDIQDPDDEEEQLYIGTASFQDANGEFLIYDWRAPISSIYYNGTLGEVSYETPMGVETTNLKKKRQFQIKDGKINNMFDTNETVGDEMLQQALGENNDEYMRNIVATIQREQNDIIRDTTSNLLIVQGVAGSGKTSAILQRIAFLLYHSRDTLEADQIVLFSPNKLFSHYISEVLPSLGERNMRQATFAEFIDNRLQGIKIQSLFQRYEGQSKKTPLSIIQFKESGEFIDQLIKYCDQLTSDDIQFSNIELDGSIIFSKADIKAIYDQLPTALKTSDKITDTKNALIKNLKQRIIEETQADWVNNRIDQLSNQKYHDLLQGKRLGDFQDEDDARFYIAKQIVTAEFKPVYDAIFNNNLFDPYIQYGNFLKAISLPDTIEEQAWQAEIENYLAEVEYHRLTLEDAAPLAYLRDYIAGSGKNHTMKYLFVDEMQDYSLAQLKYLRYAFPAAKWTLLGDSEQALFKESERPEALLSKLEANFNFRKSRLINLKRAYRSTYEITTFAKNLIPNGEEITAFNRHGSPCEIVMTNSETFISTAIATIKSQINRYETVAIITKDEQTAREAYHQLHSQFEVALVEDADRILPKGLLIIPIYLAKGLEFDSVIAWNTSKQTYNNESELGVIYTIATRAMHSLTFITNGELTPLITEKAILSSEAKLIYKI